MPHSITEEVVAERVRLPFEIATHDWSSGGALTLKRKGGLMQVFVDSQFVTEFPISRFAVNWSMLLRPSNPRS